MLNALFSMACWLLALMFAFRRKRALAIFVLVIGFAWLLYSPSLLTWIEHLGSDSFSEVQNFDLVEAMSFVQSLDQVIRRQSLRTTAFIFAIGLILALLACDLVFPALRRRRIDTGRIIAGASAVAIVGIVWFELHPAFSAFRSNSEIYGRIHDNFHEQSRARVLQNAPVDALEVVVYIGESIAAANMGIYGYPRATTPELERFAAANANLFVFHDVFAPHVHTAPSLLEALSVGLAGEQDWLPIGNRLRVSIVDLLNQAGISPVLFSNQGSSGAWNNLASTIVFRNVAESEFSFNSAWLGELEYRVKRPLDGEFLPPVLARRYSGRTSGREVVFLHSYAGHGPYLRHVDEAFRRPVDGFLEGLPAEAIVGDGLAAPAQVVRTIEDYDSTIRYVDHVVVAAMRSVQARPAPAVFFFFSDHGDGVYAGRLHDSSRFLHEMARVPFIVYFNDAAASRYAEMAGRLRRAAARRSPATLAQFPVTLLALFGLEIEGARLPGVGEGQPLAMPPILTRQTGAGFTYVRPGPATPPSRLAGAVTDATDFHTRVFRATRWREADAPRMCLYRTNTIGKLIRGALVADCLWLDVAEDEDGEPAVEPTPAVPTGLNLGTALHVARSSSRSLWVADRMADPRASCRALAAVLPADVGEQSAGGMVTFATSFPWNDPTVRGCIGRLRSGGFSIAVELPAEALAACKGEPAMERSRQGRCAELVTLMQAAEASELVTGIAFEYRFVETMQKIAAGIELEWNAWNVPLDVLESGALSRFHMVAVAAPPGPNDR